MSAVVSVERERTAVGEGLQRTMTGVEPQRATASSSAPVAGRSAFEPTHPSVQLMMREHQNVRRMCAVIRAASRNVLAGASVPVQDMRGMIAFVREYSDAHHHAKEEKYLFPEMVARLGRPAENLVTHGMLVEHNLGRAHVLNWENALGAYEAAADEGARLEAKLDIVAEAVGYATLLTAHTQKEDTAVYPFAERNLDEAVLNQIDAACDAYEQQASPAQYEGFLADMEQRYR